MPFIKAQAAHCNEEHPCRSFDPCPKCEAQEHMTQDDWLAVAVFRAASDQYINQTPLGRGEGKPPILTPRLEGWESALRLSNIEATPSDIDAAVLLFHLVNGSEGWEINWIKETGKTQYEIEPEDLNGAD